MTDNELRLLAEFAGMYSSEVVFKHPSDGCEYVDIVYVFPCGAEIKQCCWNPLEDWNHLKIVMEALVRIFALGDKRWWDEVLGNLAVEAATNPDFDFSQAICEATLGVSWQEKSYKGICKLVPMVKRIS